MAQPELKVGDTFVTNEDENLIRLSVYKVIDVDADGVFRVETEDGVEYNVAWNDFDKTWEDQDADLSIEDDDDELLED
jgi:phage gp45-like